MPIKGEIWVAIQLIKKHHESTYNCKSLNKRDFFPQMIKLRSNFSDRFWRGLPREDVPDALLLVPLGQHAGRRAREPRVRRRPPDRGTLQRHRRRPRRALQTGLGFRATYRILHLKLVQGDWTGSMSRRNWIEPSRARSGHQISCCLVSFHFMCEIPSGRPVVRTSSWATL